MANHLIILTFLLTFMSKRCISWNLRLESVKLPSPNLYLPYGLMPSWHDIFLMDDVTRNSPSAKTAFWTSATSFESTKAFWWSCCDTYLSKCWICANWKMYFLFLLQLSSWKSLLSKWPQANILTIHTCILF